MDFMAIFHRQVMKLANAELLPGVVVDNQDPKCLGRIKPIIAGKSNPDTMKTENLPWCAPLTSGGYQRLSMPEIGQKVWILHDNENYYEYYWLPAWEVNSNSEATTPIDEYDILVSRTGDGYGSQLYYNQEEGFMTRIGENASTNMKLNGDIENFSNDMEMSIRGANVYIGKKDENNEPMVLGTQIKKLLEDLATKLSSLSEKAARANPYTSPLALPILECSDVIKSKINDILSQSCHVTE